MTNWSKNSLKINKIGCYFYHSNFSNKTSSEPLYYHFDNCKLSARKQYANIKKQDE